jgi:hypothetical protein
MTRTTPRDTAGRHAAATKRAFTPTELDVRRGLRADVLARLDAPVTATDTADNRTPADILTEFPGFLLDATPRTLTLLGTLPASRQIRFIEALLAHHAPTRELRRVGMLPNATDERGRPIVSEAVWARWESRLAHLKATLDAVGDIAVAHGV